jgi:hypothetical protein
VIDTSRFVCGNRRHILGGFTIMAMAVIHPFVAPLVLSAKGCRNKMIYFEQITVAKIESTSRALSLLYLKELRLFVVHEWVLLEPLYPLEQIAIIWA